MRLVRPILVLVIYDSHLYQLTSKSPIMLPTSKALLIEQKRDHYLEHFGKLGNDNN